MQIESVCELCLMPCVPCDVTRVGTCMSQGLMGGDVMNELQKHFFNAFNDHFPWTITYIVTRSRSLGRKSGASGDKAARPPRTSRHLFWPWSMRPWWVSIGAVGYGHHVCSRTGRKSADDARRRSP